MALKKFPPIKKIIAVTLILCVLNNITAPGIAYALTSGPVNPDATSFEPIDTTDMVNLLSGDLAYNIPLIEVPGPEGGYPLALSYHAGIMPDEEASWVGLGWSLGPGAINRTVSGFPDDFNGQQNTVRDYWAGGNRTTTSVGVNIGLTGVLSADFGLSVSHDTFLGTGIGGFVGLSAGMKLAEGAGASASIGLAIDPFGGLSVNGGIGLSATFARSGNGSLGAGLGIGFSANSEGLNAGAGAGISASLSRGDNYAKSAFGSASTSLLGASISSGGGGVSLSTGGGYSNIENVNAGRIQSQSRSWGVTIPVWFGISLSIKRNYLRYWSDETQNTSTNGSLNYPTVRENIPYFGSEYDTYYLADVNDPSYDLLGKNDPVKSTGGSFPDYDTYSVLGQGISGNIRPYGYQMEIVGKGRYLTSYTTNREYKEGNEEYHCDTDPRTGEDYNCGTITNYTTYLKNPSKLNFRFINDFSNKYEQQNTILNDNSNLNFDLNPVYGNNDGTYGYDAAKERLASSKNIEYFTNDEIKNGSAKLQGFIDSKAEGFDRSLDPKSGIISNTDKRIGGFMITNESGITYHYALPVYAYDEYTKTENIYGVTQYNEQKRENPYATSWMLTAVTGPDYVDVNNNGYVDQGDWGYWVSFEYGKWAADYSWRNPGLNNKKDLDGRFQFHSTGKRELYYLDAVITPTHTAIFEKEIRADGKGMYADNPGNPYGGLSTALLRLNNIILVNNNALPSGGINSIRRATDKYHQFVKHYGRNVIDKWDIGANQILNSEIIRKINLNYDYSLCPNVPNSYDENGTMYDSGVPYSSLVKKSGKLTLNNLTFLGKGGEASIPPMHFDYDIPSELTKQSNSVVFLDKKPNSDVYRFKISDFQLGSAADFNLGDIVKFNHNETIFYALIKQVSNVANSGGSSYSKTMEVKFLSNFTPTANVQYSWTSTKNPPYLSDNYDMWGLFKADYTPYNGNENLSRLPSKASAQSTDVWSLRRVRHPLGMTTDIIYESDTYSKVALYRNAAIQVNTVESISNGKFKVYCSDIFGIDLRDFILSGDKVQLNISGNYEYQTYDDQYGNPMTSVQGISLSSGQEPSLLVTEVGENYVILNDSKFYDVLFVNQAGSNVSYYGGNMSAGGIGNNLGGGLRIKKIVNNEPITGVNLAVNYNYNRPDNSLLSSGTTSYEPLGLDAVSLRAGGDETAYRNVLLKSFSRLLGVVREVPAPGVMYEYVSVSSERSVDGQTTQQIGKSQYQFEVFNEGMVGLWNLNPIKYPNREFSTILLQNNTSRVGSLHRIIKYDADGNKLSETINHYLHDEQKGNSAESNKNQYKSLLAKYNDQGVLMERTAEGRYNDGKSRSVMSMRESYPTIMTGSTTIDYKTGLKSSSQTLAYDFYSGQPTRTLSVDAYGNRFVSEVKPAYRVYPEMGLKINNSKNANMLSQVAEQLVYKVDQNNNATGLLSASATVWSNQINMLNDTEQSVNTKQAHSSQPNIWRKYKTYNWLPQDRAGGLTSLNSFTPYHAGGNNLTGWILSSQITLYNKYSNPLEAFDINGNYSTTRMGYNQSKVVATANPAGFYEMTYAGLEDEVLSNGMLARNIALGSATIVSNISHTGIKSAKLLAGQSGITYSTNTNNLKNGRNYAVSAWMKTSGDPLKSTVYYRVNGGSKVNATVDLNKKAGGWYLVSLQIPGSVVPPNGTLEIGCTNNDSVESFFDDFRFSPINASMMSYVYDIKTGELNYTLDDHNLFSKFEYDSQGRLIKTYRETLGYGIRQLNEFSYNYASSTTPKWQQTTNYRCQTQNGVNTGLQEAQENDVNPLSPTYNQSRWVVIGSSTTCGIVPEPCSGLNKRMVNGICETGRKRYTRTVTAGNMFACYFRYEFSDGFVSTESVEISQYRCTVN